MRFPGILTLIVTFLHAALAEAATFPPRGPKVGVLAYVVTRCSIDDADGAILEQELRVQRGDDAPTSVAKYRLVDIRKSQLKSVDEFWFRLACQFFGQARGGGGAELAAPINRIRVSPNGRRVIFHVSDAQLPLNKLFQDMGVDIQSHLTADTPRGYYVVNEDGTGLKWLGHESSLADSVLDRTKGPTDPSKWEMRGSASVVWFSPDNRHVVSVDRDQIPGSEGDDSLQIMLLDVKTGKQRQLTDVRTPSCESLPGQFEVRYPSFLSRRAIVFERDVASDPAGGCDLVHHNFTSERCEVGVDNSKVVCKGVPQVGTDQVHLDPELAILGRRLSLFALTVKPSTDPDHAGIEELFVQKGRDFLQLTDLGHSSTRVRFLTPNGARAFFVTSTDPGNRCELFSVGTLGQNIRQITSFNSLPNEQPDDPMSGSGCKYSGNPGCAIGGTFQDPITKAVVFASNCDLLNTAVSGEHIFTMWPDGSGIHQLTHERGCEGDCKLGTLVANFTRVELPGFLSYAPTPRRSHR